MQSFLGTICCYFQIRASLGTLPSFQQTLNTVQVMAAHSHIAFGYKDKALILFLRILSDDKPYAFSKDL